VLFMTVSAAVPVAMPPVAARGKLAWLFALFSLNCCS